MKYTMSDRERGRLKLISGAIDGVHTVGQVAMKLDISARRVKTLKKAVGEQGDGAVIHGNSKRHPANHTDDEIRRNIILPKKSDAYCDTNFTYFRELLSGRENIKTGYTALAKILKSAGIVPKKKHSNGGKRFKRRKRRSQFGQLLQADATSFDRVKTGVRYALHGFIDDATGNLAGLYMCQNECLQGYPETLRQTLTKYGVPLSYTPIKRGCSS